MALATEYFVATIVVVCIVVDPPGLDVRSFLAGVMLLSFLVSGFLVVLTFGRESDTFRCTCIGSISAVLLMAVSWTGSSLLFGELGLVSLGTIGCVVILLVFTGGVSGLVYSVIASACIVRKVSG
jgi:hypothetical protein